MRDLIITAMILGTVPFILWRPWLGIIVWCWISYMNPHRLCWGFAVNMPFALIIAVSTLLAFAFSSEPKKVPWTRETIVLLLFVCWMFVSTIFSLYQDEAWPMLDRIVRIQFMTFVSLMLITTRQRLSALLWIIAVSIGFYGIKGGLFTLASGGSYHVYGPDASFISGNNEVALALVMTIPLMRYLQLQSPNRWVRIGLTGAMLLSAIAAIGSQSRGALLALLAMGLFLWLKGSKKFFVGLLIGGAALVAVAVMPPEWYERMNTIQTYDQDASAMGRINAWWCAWNLVTARPLVGGGFEAFKQASTFAAYAPDPIAVHDLHSIYFQALGEHGFVGLALFTLLWVMTWRTATSISVNAQRTPDTKWMAELARMLQASFVGYATGGAFLGLAYFDLPYHLMAMVVIMKILLQKNAASEDVSSKSGGQTTADGAGNHLQPHHSLG